MTVLNNSGFIDILGPQVRFLTSFVGNPSAYCALDAVVPAGTRVPLHSHGERETLVVSSGQIEAFKDGSWACYASGDALDIPSGVPHAIRNVANEPARLLMVTYESMGQFFQSIGLPLDGGEPQPDEDRIHGFIASAIGNGFWLGSAEDNLAIGM
ncbi:cupin domain-containing protein [Ensifer sp. ENS08]|uniref:cupin domain-containing protein n=1 Tax=Ensifer sp. ENS08 TaxID=2769273 RepID=UPI0017800FD0|nr:cupin domain-containing protein [Ensifer sp. ENS08]MBD9571916.1 cupin domain-containing protein [Ensifer sp. ENS08]